jgi:hypothetical protein
LFLLCFLSFFFFLSSSSFLFATFRIKQLSFLTKKHLECALKRVLEFWWPFQSGPWLSNFQFLTIFTHLFLNFTPNCIKIGPWILMFFPIRSLTF